MQLIVVTSIVVTSIVVTSTVVTSTVVTSTVVTSTVVTSTVAYPCRQVYQIKSLSIYSVCLYCAKIHVASPQTHIFILFYNHNKKQF